MAEVVEIIFRTKGELEGAIAVQRELERTRGKLLALGESTADVDKKLDRLNGILAKTKSPEITSFQSVSPRLLPQNFEEDAGKMESTFDQLHHQTRGLGHLLREFGLNSHAFFSPFTLGATVAVAAIAKINEYFEKLNENLKIGGKFESFADAFKSQAAALENAELSASAYERSLSRAGDASKKLSEATALEINQLAAKARREDEQRSASLALDKAKIDAKEKSGELAPEAAISARAVLEEKFAKQKLDSENQLQRQILVRKQAEREELKTGVEPERRQLTEAQRSLALAETPETIRARIATAEKNKKATDEEREKAVEGGDAGRITQAIQAQKIAASALEAELQRSFADLDKFNSLKEEVAGLESSVRARRARLDSLGAELNALILNVEADIESRKKVGGIESETKGIQRQAEVAPKIGIAAAAAEGEFRSGASAAESLAGQAIKGGFAGDIESNRALAQKFASDLGQSVQVSNGLLSDMLALIQAQARTNQQLALQLKAVANVNN